MSSYESALKHLSNLAHINTGLIENLLGTILVGIGYVLMGRVLRHRVIQKLPEEYQEEIISDIIPSLLKLITFGLLAKIWLTGQSSFESAFQISPSFMMNILQTLYVALFYMGLKYIGEVITDIQFAHNATKQYTIRRSVTIISSVVCTFLLLKIWLSKSTNFSTYLGLLSAGMAIALQDIIVSVVGWVYILLVKPLKIGDRIQIGDKTGDVIEIKLLQFYVLETGHWVGAEQATGRILYFPNSFIFKNNIANYDAGFEFIFAEMSVTITFESDWKEAKKLLQKILAEHALYDKEKAQRQIHKASREMRLQFSHLDPKVIVSIADSGVILALRFICKVRERRLKEAAIWEAILESFGSSQSIDFAYPTIRYYFNPEEGKELAGKVIK